METDFIFQLIGYLLAFNNGFILQFGSVILNGTNQTTVNLPITFQQSDIPRVCALLMSGGISTTVVVLTERTISRLGFTKSSSLSGSACLWIAVGY